MADARFIKALSRIDAAAARIEARLAADAGLAARHARLREETGRVLARLDQLIAAAERAD